MPVSQGPYRCWVFDLPPGTDDEGLTTHFASEAAARIRAASPHLFPDGPVGVKPLTAPCWTATCDGECADEFEDDEGGNHGASRTETEQMVTAYGWTVTRDGTVFCPDDEPDCSTADLAVTEQIPGQLILEETPGA